MMQVYWSNKASSPAASFDGGRLCCFLAAAGRVIRVVGSTKLPRYMKSALTALVWMELTGRGEVGAGARRRRGRRSRFRRRGRPGW
jgi:hypothetical protein